VSKRVSLSVKIALVVGLSVLVVLGTYFWGMVRTEAGQEGYDYIVPLGEVRGLLGIAGAVVLDKRTGDIWVFGVDPKTFKLESEYCGHIEEFIRKEGVKEEIARKSGGGCICSLIQVQVRLGTSDSIWSDSKKRKRAASLAKEGTSKVYNCFRCYSWFETPTRRENERHRKMQFCPFCGQRVYPARGIEATVLGLYWDMWKALGVLSRALLRGRGSAHS